MNRLALALLVIAAAACSKDTQDKVKDKIGQAGSAVDRMAVDDMKESITAIKAAIAAGEDPFTKCASGLAMAKQTDVDEAKPLAAELIGLCDHDVPLANATRAVEAAEKARAAGHPGDVISECYEASWETARDKLDRTSKQDPAWTALKGRWAEACPD